MKETGPDFAGRLALQHEVGFRCVAAPVFDSPGRIAAAISIVGTVGQITSEITSQNLPRLTELLKQTAAGDSRAISIEPAARV